jgi:hypothetical protein
MASYRYFPSVFCEACAWSVRVGGAGDALPADEDWKPGCGRPVPPCQVIREGWV